MPAPCSAVTGFCWPSSSLWPRGVRLVYTTLPRVVWGDEPFYLWMGQSLLAGQGYNAFGYSGVHFPPLFALTAAALAPLAGGLLNASNLIHVLTGALLVVPLFLLARAIYSPPRGLDHRPCGGAVPGADQRRAGLGHHDRAAISALGRQRHLCSVPCAGVWPDARLCAVRGGPGSGLPDAHRGAGLSRHGPRPAIGRPADAPRPAGGRCWVAWPWPPACSCCWLCPTCSIPTMSPATGA
jgi:hypothetical protein